MIILLNKSSLFTTHPNLRFAKEYNSTPEVWWDVWRRHELGYTQQELRDYIRDRTGRTPELRAVRRWITRAKIYNKAHQAILKGAHSVTDEYFGEYAPYVINEIMRNMKSSGTRSPRSLA
jgi:hypothetical protein